MGKKKKNVQTTKPGNEDSKGEKQNEQNQQQKTQKQKRHEYKAKPSPPAAPVKNNKEESPSTPSSPPTPETNLQGVPFNKESQHVLPPDPIQRKDEGPLPTSSIAETTTLIEHPPSTQGVSKTRASTTSAPSVTPPKNTVAQVEAAKERRKAKRKLKREKKEQEKKAKELEKKEKDEDKETRERRPEGGKQEEEEPKQQQSSRTSSSLTTTLTETTVPSSTSTPPADSNTLWKDPPTPSLYSKVAATSPKDSTPSLYSKVAATSPKDPSPSLYSKMAATTPPKDPSPSRIAATNSPKDPLSPSLYSRIAAYSPTSRTRVEFTKEDFGKALEEVIKDRGYLTVDTLRRRLQAKNVDHLSFVKTQLGVLGELSGTITTTIKSAISSNLVLTVYDIEKTLLSLNDFKGRSRFSSWHLGSLLNYPDIQTFFRPPPDLKEVPMVTSEDIIAQITAAFANANFVNASADVQSKVANILMNVTMENGFSAATFLSTIATDSDAKIVMDSIMDVATSPDTPEEKVLTLAAVCKFLQSHMKIILTECQTRFESMDTSDNNNDRTTDYDCLLRWLGILYWYRLLSTTVANTVAMSLLKQISVANLNRLLLLFKYSSVTEPVREHIDKCMSDIRAVATPELMEQLEKLLSSQPSSFQPPQLLRASSSGKLDIKEKDHVELFVELIESTLDSYAASLKLPSRHYLCYQIRAWSYFKLLVSRARTMSRKAKAVSIKTLQGQLNKLQEEQRNDNIRSTITSITPLITELQREVADKTPVQIFRTAEAFILKHVATARIKSRDVSDLLVAIAAYSMGNVSENTLRSALHLSGPNVKESLLHLLKKSELQQGLLTFLYKLEKEYLQLIEASEHPQDVPCSLFQYIQIHDELKRKFEKLMKHEELKARNSHSSKDEELGEDVGAHIPESGLVDHLKQLLESEIIPDPDSNTHLHVLDKLEQMILEQYRVSSFESLGHGRFSSFISRHYAAFGNYFKSFSSSNSEIMEKSKTVKAQMNTRDRAIAVKLLELWNTQNASLETNSQAPLLCWYFGVHNIDKLGYSSVEELLSTEDSIPAEDMNQSLQVTKVKTIQGLFVGAQFDQFSAVAQMSTNSRNDSSFTCYPSSAPSANLTEAIQAINNAPYLVDLYEWTRWDAVYRQHFGDLTEFVACQSFEFQLLQLSRCQIVKCHDIKELDQLSQIDTKEQQQLLAVLKRKSIDRVSQAMQVAERIGRRIASEAVGFVVSVGDVQAVSFNLMKDYLTRKLKELWKLLPDDLQSIFLLHLVAHAIFVLPLGLFPTIGQSVILDAAEKLVVDTIRRLVQHCTTPAEALLLRRLGAAFDIPDWSNFRLDSVTLHVDASATILHEEVEEPTQAEEVKATTRRFNEGKAEEKEPDLPIPTHTATFAPVLHHTYPKDEQECIDTLRAIKIKFGIDKDDPEIKEVQKLAARSIQRLASELYADKVHAVLELTQNADDNTYPASAVPSITFTLTQLHQNDSSSLGLCIDNNEIGFSIQNVNAVCDVSESTKTASSIGKKGIGFKSVFKLSDCPEIHSGLWHFGFNKNDGKLGYIIPKLLPAPEGWDSTKPQTRIVLPLQNSTVSQLENSVHSIADHLHKLPPSMLLFLRKIKYLKVNINLPPQSMLPKYTQLSIKRLNDVECFARVRVQELLFDSTSISEKNWVWLMKRMDLDVPEEASKHKTTQICIAIPIRGLDVLDNGELHAEDNYQVIDSPEPVFAFLPLRPYGLRFIIQADWIVTSSREAIDGGYSWNEWLLDKVPLVFKAAVKDLCAQVLKIQEEVIKEEQSDDILEEGDDDNNNELFADKTKEQLEVSWDSASLLLLNTLFQVCPLQNQAVEFFARLPNRICKELSDVAFVPTASVELVTPSQAVHLSEDIPEDLQHMTSKFLKSQLNLHLTEPRVKISPPLAQQLGIRSLGADLLTSLLKNLAKGWKTAADVPTDWLVWVLQRLATDERFSKNKNKEELARIQMFPMEDGSLKAASPEDGSSIFMRIDDMNQNAQFPGSLQSMILDREFVNSLKRYHMAMVITSRLGIKKLDEHSLAELISLPVLLDPSSHSSFFGSDSKDQKLAELLLFIIKHCHSNICNKCKGNKWLSEIISKHKAEIYLGGADGSIKKNTPLLFPPSYWSAHSKLASILTSHFRPYELLTSHYFPPKMLKSTLEHTAEHLLELGAFPLFRVTPSVKRISVEDISQHAEDLQPQLSEFIKLHPDATTIEITDYTSVDLQTLIEEIMRNTNHSTMKELFEALQSCWKWYSSFAFQKIEGSETNVPSNWLHYLRSSEWCPSENTTKLFLPSKLFYKSSGTYALFKDWVHYTPKSVSQKFATDIGICCEVKQNDILEVLSSWANDYKVIQELSVDFMGNIYKQLLNNVDYQQMQIVFVPEDRQLRKVCDCTWYDTTDLLEQSHKNISPEANKIARQVSKLRALRPHYQEFASVMLNTLKVREHSSDEDHVNMLIAAAKGKCTEDSATVLLRVLSYYGYQDEIPFPETLEKALRWNKAIAVGSWEWKGADDPYLVLVEEGCKMVSALQEFPKISCISYHSMFPRQKKSAGHATRFLKEAVGVPSLWGLQHIHEVSHESTVTKEHEKLMFALIATYWKLLDSKKNRDLLTYLRDVKVITAAAIHRIPTLKQQHKRVEWKVPDLQGNKQPVAAWFDSENNKFYLTQVHIGITESNRICYEFWEIIKFKLQLVMEIPPELHNALNQAITQSSQPEVPTDDIWQSVYGSRVVQPTKSQEVPEDTAHKTEDASDIVSMLDKKASEHRARQQELRAQPQPAKVYGPSVIFDTGIRSSTTMENSDHAKVFIDPPDYQMQDNNNYKGNSHGAPSSSNSAENTPNNENAQIENPRDVPPPSDSTTSPFANNSTKAESVEHKTANSEEPKTTDKVVPLEHPDMIVDMGNRIVVADIPWIISEQTQKMITSKEEPHFVGSTNEKLAVGRYGEEIVKQMLLNNALTGYSDINWINEHEEKGEPYDFTATYNGETVWIEVKTQGKQASWFQITNREWLKANDTGSRYHILFVQLANDSVRLAQIIDPVQKLNANILQLVLTLKDTHQKV